MGIKVTTITALNQVLEPIKSNGFSKFLKPMDADRYVKKFSAFKFIPLMIYAQLNQLPSLKEISSSLSSEDLRKIIGLESISHSQISRRLRDFDPMIVKQLFKDIVQRTKIELGTKLFSKASKSLILIDSTTISISFSKYP